MLTTPKKDLACSEEPDSTSKTQRPRTFGSTLGVQVSMEASSELKSSTLGVQVSMGSSNEFKSSALGVQVSMKSSNELKSPGVNEVQRSRAPPASMGTCKGQRPPKDTVKRQAFENMRLQQQRQQPKPKCSKMSRPSARTKMSQARCKYIQHVAKSVHEFRANHPCSYYNKAADLAHAGQSYNRGLEQQGLESKRATADRARIARIARKQAQDAQWQTEAEERQKRAAQVKQERLEKMNEGLQRKREVAKVQTTRIK